MCMLRFACGKRARRSEKSLRRQIEKVAPHSEEFCCGRWAWGLKKQRLCKHLRGFRGTARFGQALGKG